MQRTADVVVAQYGGIRVIKVGEMKIEDDGTFSGKLLENEELALPVRISESTETFVFSLVFLPEPIRYA